MGLGLAKQTHTTQHIQKIFNKPLNSKTSSLPQQGKYIEKVFIRRYISAKINSNIFFSKTLENRNGKKKKKQQFNTELLKWLWTLLSDIAT